MPQDDLTRLRDQLNDRLSTYDWDGVGDTVDEIAQVVADLKSPFDEGAARNLLLKLRESRRFDEMLRLSRAIEKSGQHGAFVRRLTAQAFIDSGKFPEALFLLEALRDDAATPAGERTEALGLIGRVYKQSFVNVKTRYDWGRPSDLNNAIDSYNAAYVLDPANNVWPGINAVALFILRGGRDKDKARSMAETILKTLEAKQRDSTENSLPSWDHATRMEACVALGRHEDAATAASDYVGSPGVTAFALEATRRQMTEVWGLKDETDPGRAILPLLRAALLRRSGGALTLQRVGEGPNAGGLEKKFGPEGSQDIGWFRKGESRGRSVARIEKASKGIGTGWLVRATDFFNKASDGELLLLTNAHVVATKEIRDQIFPPAMAREDVRVDFMTGADGGTSIKVREIVWCSPVKELDATFLRLESVPAGIEPVPLSSTPVQMANPAPRMYVIGHPGGRNLEISLYDNRLVACNESKLHYRTPTEEGSSGSPVFEPLDWTAVGLHHKGLNEMPALDGSGTTYQANEGITILAIQDATRKLDTTI